MLRCCWCSRTHSDVLISAAPRAGAARQPARRGVARPRQARRCDGLGMGRGSVRGTEKKTTRRRAEAEMNEEEVSLVLKLPNFRLPSSRPPKITHYFRRPCQRPSKTRQFSAAVSVAAENRLIFGGLALAAENVKQYCCELSVTP
jgi:hypothetical protein